MQIRIEHLSTYINNLYNMKEKHFDEKRSFFRLGN